MSWVPRCDSTRLPEHAEQYICKYLLTRAISVPLPLHTRLSCDRMVGVGLELHMNGDENILANIPGQ